MAISLANLSDMDLARRRTGLQTTLVQPPTLKPAIAPTVTPTTEAAAKPPSVTPGTPTAQPAVPKPNIAPTVVPSVPAAGQPVPAAAPPPVPTAQPAVPQLDLPRPGPGEPNPKAPIDFLTGFGPEDDLRFQQVNPVATERLRGLQGDVTGAQRALATGPNLGEAAQERLRLLEEQSQPAFERALQTVGQRAGALGRLGAGMTTSDLGDVLTQRERALSQARRGLASDTAFAEGGERRANLSSLAGLESQLYGQEAGQRGEVRGERGYQADTAQQSLQNRIQQRALEESLLDAAFRRQATRAQLGLQGAELYGREAEAGGQTSADLLQTLAYQEALKNRARRPGTTAGAPAPELPG